MIDQFSTINPSSTTKIRDCLLVALCYVIAVELSKLFVFNPSALTYLYFPSGVILAAILIRGFYLWPGIFLSVLLTNFISYLDVDSYENLGNALFFGISNATGDTLGALAGAFLIRRNFGSSRPFSQVSHVAGFIIFGAMLNGAISAAFGTSGLAAAGFIPWDRVVQVFPSWWAGDLVGVVILVPLLLSWRNWKNWQWFSQGKLIGLFFVLFSLALLTLLAFRAIETSSNTSFPLLLLMPLLVFSALRFPERITYMATLLVALIISVVTAKEIGPLPLEEVSGFYIELQLFLFVISATTLALLALATEREVIEKALIDSEDSFEVLADTTFEGIVVHDQGKIVKVNKQFIKMHDFEDKDELLGTPLIELLDPDSIEKAIAHTDGRSDVPHQLNARKRDGTIFPVDVLVRNQCINGRDLQIVSVKNLSDVKQQQLKLENAIQEAEKMSMAKTRFMSNMSHELRTPLNAVLGFASLLEMDAEKLDQKHINAIQKIRYGGQHLLSLVNEMLDLTKIEAGDMTVDMRSVELKPLLAECSDLASSLVIDKTIKIHFDSAPNYVLRCDPLKLKQVLLNYLSNAVAYNVEGGTVEVHYAKLDSTRLRITVTDSGIGLSESQIASLFRPFERLNADKLGIDGVGIGLAISKNLVELMGGVVGVESSPGKGSSFWLELELKEAVDDEQLSQQAAIIDNTTDLEKAASVTEKTVLYIDDNIDNLELLEQAINSYMQGYKLIGCTSPFEGLEVAIESKPVLILLDIKMPGMDGFEVLAKLRANHATRDIPVIAVSGNAMPTDVEEGLAAGFSDYITKPFSLTKIMSLVKEY